MESKVTQIGSGVKTTSDIQRIIQKTSIDMKQVQNMNGLESLDAVTSGLKIMGYDTTANKVGLLPASELTGENKHWGGRKWLKTASTPTAAGYIGDASFLAKFPDLIGLGCYLVKNDHSRTKLDPTNHYLTADGKTAALDGSMGHYQWGWGKPFYYATWDDGTYVYEAVSLSPINGHTNWRIPVASCSASGNATIDRTNGNMVSYCNTAEQYRGGNNDSAKDGTYRSMLGLCATNMTTAAFETAARKNGDRWCSGFHGMIYIRAALFRVIMGTRNVQASVNTALDANGLKQGGLGNGCSYPSDWLFSWGSYPFLPMDAGADLGDYTGVFSKEITGSDGNALTITDIPSFYGLKNFYKYIYVMSGSMFGYDNADGTMDFYVNPKLDANSLALTVEAMTKAGTGVGLHDWTYPKNYGSKLLCPTPLDTGGTTSTYFCDGFYKGPNSAGSRLCLFGGSSILGYDAGLLFLNASAGLSYAELGCGALLCESAEDWDCEGFEWE